MHFSWSNIWLESRSVFWNFLFINSYGLKAERSNREVRNIRVSDLMLVGLIILEISLFIKSWKKIKQEDSFERNKGRSFDYKISDIWIYKSFDFFEGNCLFWNLVVGFKRSVKMFQKTFEVLQAIDDLATEYYEKIKTDCDTYEDLEKGLRGMSYVDFGRFNTSRDYLVKVMRQKIEKEKSSLHIIKQEEKAVSVDKIAKHMAKILNEI